MECLGESYSINNRNWSDNIIGLDCSKSIAIPNGNGIVLTNGVRNNTV